MTRRQVLRLHLCPAAGTVELDDSTPAGIGSEAELAVDASGIDVSRIAVVEEQPALVVLPRGADRVIAYRACPALGLEVDVQVLRDVHPRAHACPFQSKLRRSAPCSSTTSVQPGGTAHVVVAESTSAGPCSSAPLPSRSREWTGVVRTPRSGQRTSQEPSGSVAASASASAIRASSTWGSSRVASSATQSVPSR